MVPLFCELPDLKTLEISVHFPCSEFDCLSSPFHPARAGESLLVHVSPALAQPAFLPVDGELRGAHGEVFCISCLQSTISISLESEPLSLLTCFCLGSDFIISNLHSSYHFLFLFLIMEFHPAIFISVSSHSSSYSTRKPHRLIFCF